MLRASAAEEISKEEGDKPLTPSSTMLELVKKGHAHDTDIEKRMVATCLDLAASSTVRRQFYDHLFPNGCVGQVVRRTHRMTRKVVAIRHLKLMEIRS